MSAARFSLFKLSKTNFSLWLFQVRNVLESESIDYVLDPDAAPESHPKWKAEQGLAKSIIVQALDKTTAYQIADFFQSRSKRFASATNLHEELSSLVWTAANIADDFISKLTSIKLRMAEVGLTVDYSRLVQKFISSRLLVFHPS